MSRPDERKEFPQHVELRHSTAPDEPSDIYWLFHNTAPNIPPTYNHTRGDSILTPCPVCKERRSRGYR